MDGAAGRGRRARLLHRPARPRTGQGAPGARDVELNRALGQVLAGLWAEVEPERDRLRVEFELRAPTEQRLPGGEPLMPMFASRPTLPPRRLDDYVVEPRQTETQTLV
jgi:hypothetical protein